MFLFCKINIDFLMIPLARRTIVKIKTANLTIAVLKKLSVKCKILLRFAEYFNQQVGII